MNQEMYVIHQNIKYKNVISISLLSVYSKFFSVYVKLQLYQLLVYEIRFNFFIFFSGKLRMRRILSVRSFFFFFFFVMKYIHFSIEEDNYTFDFYRRVVLGYLHGYMICTTAYTSVLASCIKMRRRTIWTTFAQIAVGLCVQIVFTHTFITIMLRSISFIPFSLYLLLL